MNIHPQASDKSRQYHNELDEIVRQREERKKKDSLEQRQKSVEVNLGPRLTSLLQNTRICALFVPHYLS